MVALRPLRALRPEPSAAAAVAAVPYDVVSTNEARALAAGNPLSFLHVSRAEIDLPDDTDPHADVVYATAATNLAKLRSSAPLVVETRPSLYVYRLRMGGHVQTGVAAGFSVDEYERDVIRKHERTRKDKEDDRTRHIIELRAQTGPVFLVYPAEARIDALVDEVSARPPLFQFVAEDGVEHLLWRVPESATEALIGAFAGVALAYIADGHHRAASARRARQALARTDAAETGEVVEADAFLAVAFPHDQTQILPYHRYVTDLGGRSAEALRAELEAVVRVGPESDGPASVAMYLAGRWYGLELAAAPAGAPTADRLDVARLQDQVLAPLLGIGDPRTDERIGFIGGTRGRAALAGLVDSGAAAVAFAMRPVTIEQLMQIADDGGIMPPKSTWFEPK
ncbi:MAG TPA: DUF1015 family protein, partial [Candidatus Limnocylindrales bacterium]